MHLRLAFVALLAALALAFPQAARADERILGYASDIQVLEDGSLDVTETIRVRVEWIAIQHGIFRDFPTRRGGRFWAPERVGFALISVERDGMPEPSSTTSITGGIRIKIGNADSFVPQGEHVYRIHYTTTRQIGYFKDFDELNWNVTGNFWNFPIDVAEARIRLPRPVSFGNRAFYTGPKGATGKDADVVFEEPGEIRFRTTATLQREEGFTVAVAWPKNVVVEPTAEDIRARKFSELAPFGAGIFGLAAVIGYYIVAWARAGRGPRAGTIVPIFTPPDGLSPSAVRYVVDMGADSRTFAAALIDLGVKGKLRLVEGEKPWFGRPKTTIEKRDGGTGDLPPGEAAMMVQLFEAGDAIVMEQKNHSIFSAAQSALTKGLKQQYDGKLFVHNWAWSLRGLALMFGGVWLTAAAVVLSYPSQNLWIVQSTWLGIGAIVLALTLVFGLRSESSALRMAVRLLAGLIGLAAVALAGMTIVLALGTGTFLPLLIPLLSLPVVVSAFHWMAAPTREGRAVLDQIAGFKQYLSITEEERLERMNPPEKTPELFERYLPFAIALEVENSWADRFSSVLAAASAAGHTQTMVWYSGNSSPWSDPDGFVDSVGSSLSSSVASASASPSSSGGGSSGGGGGGGGGGGW
jgi:uncharacterized membrane protein YgcG